MLVVLNMVQLSTGYSELVAVKASAIRYLPFEPTALLLWFDSKSKYHLLNYQSSNHGAQIPAWRQALDLGIFWLYP